MDYKTKSSDSKLKTLILEKNIDATNKIVNSSINTLEFRNFHKEQNLRSLINSSEILNKARNSDVYKRTNIPNHANNYINSNILANTNSNEFNANHNISPCVSNTLRNKVRQNLGTVIPKSSVEKNPDKQRQSLAEPLQQTRESQNFSYAVRPIYSDVDTYIGTVQPKKESRKIKKPFDSEIGIKDNCTAERESPVKSYSTVIKVDERETSNSTKPKNVNPKNCRKNCPEDLLLSELTINYELMITIDKFLSDSKKDSKNHFFSDQSYNQLSKLVKQAEEEKEKWCDVIDHINNFLNFSKSNMRNIGKKTQRKHLADKMQFPQNKEEQSANILKRQSVMTAKYHLQSNQSQTKIFTYLNKTNDQNKSSVENTISRSPLKDISTKPIFSRFQSSREFKNCKIKQMYNMDSQGSNLSADIDNIGLFRSQQKLKALSNEGLVVDKVEKNTQEPKTASNPKVNNNCSLFQIGDLFKETSVDVDMDSDIKKVIFLLVFKKIDQEYEEGFFEMGQH